VSIVHAYTELAVEDDQPDDIVPARATRTEWAEVVRIVRNKRGVEQPVTVRVFRAFYTSNNKKGQ
jgi:hypothetical protein